MAPVHGASNVVNEYLARAGLNFMRRFFCGLLVHTHTHTKRVLLFQKHIKCSSVKKSGIPLDAIDQFVYEKESIRIPSQHEEHPLLITNVACFLWPDFCRRFFEDAPRFANLITKSRQYLSPSSHCLLSPTSLPTALHHAIVIKNQRREGGGGGSILLVSLMSGNYFSLL